MVTLVRHYTKILVWENERRLNKLIEFRQLVIEYFNNSRPTGWENSSRIEEDAAREARFKINLVRDELHSIILNSGIIPILSWTAPAAIGGYVREIDLIENIFNLNGLQIEPNHVLDCIDRAVGKYDSNRKSAFVRMFNPFFYLGLVLYVISVLPFIAIGKLGFNQYKAERSVIGKLVKGVLYLIPVVAACLAILQHFDSLEPVKQFVHKLFNSSKAN